MVMWILRIAAWILREAVFLPIYLLGIPVVGMLQLLDCYTLGKDRQYHFPRWAWLWDNATDGICPSGYSPLRWYLRNPVTNLRFLPGFGFTMAGRTFTSIANCSTTPDIDPVAKGWTYALTYSGIYAGLWLRRSLYGKTLTIRLGWKLVPADVRHVSPIDGRYAGVPFAAQLHWT